MALLDPTNWHSLHGGTAEAVEPATGEVLGTFMLAAASDVERASVAAARAQRSWAGTPYPERAAVLRRAGDLIRRHEAEIAEWIIRESGSIRGKADFEIRAAAEECYEAAALAHRPLGQVLPSAAPRLSYTTRVPAGAVGRGVGELAARHLKRSHLELGGNSALLVLEDADLDAAMSTAAWASFFHQGQICMTAGRHLVHASLYDDYVERLAARADALTVGDPFREQVHLGPVIDRGRLDKIDELVRSSAAAGVRIAAGGRHHALFYRPTVLADAGPGYGSGSVGSSPAYGREVFGPVAPVRAFQTADEAVALAGDSDYGLALGIVTRDTTRALDLADRIPTGLLHINDQTVNDEPIAPFGGLADSGTGSRFGGDANLDAFTETRWTTVRATPAAYPF
ncbi:aldehyde dehydrogenase family protein [Streptomyces sp. NPDC048506]|uniref:aldehyde dehydrogenase family protein n=1 Tax=Streptomyces sp. NPDC048506 TaxID=3155028 RepID=UPI0034341A28